MKRATFYITNHQGKFQLGMKSKQQLVLLQGKCFDTERECEKFIDILRLHMRFQTNFNRTKSRNGRYGFQIRTCWDDLIAESLWYNNRADREAAMQEAFDANSDAVFTHTTMYDDAQTTYASLQVVA